MSEATRSIQCIMPAPHAFVSGGNHYNAGLMNGFQETGQHYTLHDADDLEQISPDDPVIIDSIFLRDERIRKFLETGHAKAVLLAHHLPYLFPQQPMEFRTLLLPVLELFDLVVVTGDYLEQYLLSNGVSEENVFLLEPVPNIHVARQPHPGSKMQALIASNLVERKGIHPFLHALEKANDGSRFTITIAGSPNFEPDYAEACRNLIRQSHFLSTTVRYVGVQDRASMTLLYASSDCLISPSMLETFGMAMQEAAHIGLPILALGHGNASRHVTHGLNGILCIDHTCLAQTCMEWASNRNLREQFSMRAMAEIPQYPESWGRQAELLMSKLSDRDSKF